MRGLTVLVLAMGCFSKPPSPSEIERDGGVQPTGDGGRTCPIGGWTIVDVFPLSISSDWSPTVAVTSGTLVFVSDGSGDSKLWRATAPIGNSEPTLIAETSAEIVTDVTWSYDGSFLYYSTGAVYSVRTRLNNGFGPVTIASELGGLPAGATDLGFSADGRIAVWTDNGDIGLGGRTNPTGNFAVTPNQLGTVNTVNTERSPTLANSGTTLYFVRDQGDGGRVYVTKRATVNDPFGSAQVILGLPAGVENLESSADGRTVWYARDDTGLGPSIFRATACP